MKTSANITTFNNVDPDCLNYQGLAEVRDDFKRFSKEILEPIVRKNQEVHATDNAWFDIVNKLLNDLWPTFKENGLVRSGVMYYTGESPENADDAESIEITGVEVKANGAVVPVWTLIPEKPDGIVFAADFIGKMERCSYFMKMEPEADCVIFIVYKDEEHGLPAEMTSSAVNLAAVQYTLENSPAGVYRDRVIKRAHAMGLLFPEGLPYSSVPSALHLNANLNANKPTFAPLQTNERA